MNCFFKPGTARRCGLWFDRLVGEVGERLVVRFRGIP